MVLKGESEGGHIRRRDMRFALCVGAPTSPKDSPPIASRMLPPAGQRRSGSVAVTKTFDLHLSSARVITHYEGSEE